MHTLTYTFPKKILKENRIMHSITHRFEKLQILFNAILYVFKFYILTNINFIINKRNTT